MRELVLALAVLSVGVLACGGGTGADALGVGAQCTASDECLQDEDFEQTCLTRFAGGYCGLRDCQSDLDCPEAAACIAHTDGTNYCFRICRDKAECNRNRSPEVESNCSANVVFTDGANGRKACVPPSSGT